MTTNKPTTYWAPGTSLRKLESRHNNAPCILTDTPAEFNDVALVRLADYEALQADRDQQYDMKVKAREQRDAVTAKLNALQAECEKLREHLQNLIDQTTPLEPVPGNPMWSRRIQLDEVMAERDQLRVECEKLRAAMIEAKGHIDHYMYGGSSYREPAAKAIELIDTAMQDKP